MTKSTLLWNISRQKTETRHLTSGSSHQGPQCWPKTAYIHFPLRKCFLQLQLWFKINFYHESSTQLSTVSVYSSPFVLLDETCGFSTPHNWACANDDTGCSPFRKFTSRIQDPQHLGLSYQGLYKQRKAELSARSVAWRSTAQHKHVKSQPSASNSSGAPKHPYWGVQGGSGTPAFVFVWRKLGQVLYLSQDNLKNQTGRVLP